MAASEARADPIAFAAGAGFVNVEIVLAPQSVNQLGIEWDTTRN